MNLNTPEGRYAATQALGIDGYNAAMSAHIKAQTVETVNGYAIRPVNTRFGRLFQVGTEIAFKTIEEARTHAAKEPHADQVARIEIRKRMEQYRKGYLHNLALDHKMAQTWASNYRGSYMGAAREMAALTGEPLEPIA